MNATKFTAEQLFRYLLTGVAVISLYLLKRPQHLDSFVELGPYIITIVILTVGMTFYATWKIFSRCFSMLPLQCLRMMATSSYSNYPHIAYARFLTVRMHSKSKIYDKLYLDWAMTHYLIICSLTYVFLFWFVRDLNHYDNSHISNLLPFTNHIIDVHNAPIAGKMNTLTTWSRLVGRLLYSNGISIIAHIVLFLSTLHLAMLYMVEQRLFGHGGIVHAQIVSARAYEYWNEAGRPDGNSFDFWIKAEKDLGINKQEKPEMNHPVNDKVQWAQTKPTENANKTGLEDGMLMSFYLHQDRMIWSRFQSLCVVQIATFVWASSHWREPPMHIALALPGLLVGILVSLFIYFLLGRDNQYQEVICKSLDFDNRFPKPKATPKTLFLTGGKIMLLSFIIFFAIDLLLFFFILYPLIH